MMPKIAKNATTMRKDMPARSRLPHLDLPFLVRFFEPLELLDFFDGSFEYIAS